MIGGTGYDVTLAKSLTWILNSNPDIETDFNVYIGFTIGTNHFTRIRCSYVSWLPGRALLASSDDGMEYRLYSSYAGSSEWGDGQSGAVYRTITFDEEPTGTLLTWLEANGTRQ